MSDKVKTNELIIPSELVVVSRDVFEVSPSVVENSKAFSDPKQAYNLTLVQNPKRVTRKFTVGENFFKKINVKGPLTINTENVDSLTFNICCNARWYGVRDEIDFPALTINTPGYLSFSLTSKESDVSNSNNQQAPVKPVTLKQLTLNADDVSVKLCDLPQLEKVVVNNSKQPGERHPVNYYYSNSHHWLFENCPKLKEIDISKVKSADATQLIFDQLPDDCIIKFHPDFKITYTLSSPYFQNTLKHICPKIKDNGRSISATTTIQDLFNIKSYDDSKPVCVKFKDLKQKINALADNQLEELYHISKSEAEFSKINNKSKNERIR